MTYQFENSTIDVTEIGRNKNEIHLHLKDEIGESEIRLVALWLPDLTRPSAEYFKQYAEGDYFQETFISNPKRSGLGSKLHRFIQAHHDAEFDFIRNVFSTKKSEDVRGISVDAKAFWLNRIENESAELDPISGRYKIIWV